MKRLLLTGIFAIAIFLNFSVLHLFAQSTATNTPTSTRTATNTPLSTSSTKPLPQATPSVAKSLSITDTVTNTDTLTNTDTVTETQVITAPLIHVVTYGDTLLAIASTYEVTIDELVVVNKISDANMIRMGQRLLIPNHTVTLDASSNGRLDEFSAPTDIQLPTRGAITERLTEVAQSVSATSPFYKKTWLTYYGRPNVPVMGILGEYEIADLTDLLLEKSAIYDEANGTDLSVIPAFHLVYGMATKAPGADGSHLGFLSDELVTEYISAALESNIQVILDIQIGALTPAAALEYGFPWLKYENVHLALDPEFAMSYDYQTIPGAPPGFVTAEQINEAQAAMQRYIQKNKIKGKRVLLLHQFLDTMIINKVDLANDFGGIELVISVDGWGPPAGKVSKYNQFVDETVHFSSFKLFYRWDAPLMTEREALGEDSINGYDYIDVTPNMIIYQ